MPMSCSAPRQPLAQSARAGLLTVISRGQIVPRMTPTGLTILAVLTTCVSSAAIADCAVTDASTSPVDLPADNGREWYGSDALAVLLPADGLWLGSAKRRYMDKLSFWRRGYVAMTEIRPDLVLEGVRLSGPPDGLPDRMRDDRATNAMATGFDWMMMGPTFPSAGCWQIKATYTLVDIRHELTFVVNVIDVDADASYSFQPPPRAW